MKVLKFGGTSLGSVEAILKVEKLLVEQMLDSQLIVVISAFEGVTNDLEKLPTIALKNLPKAEWKIKELQTRHLQMLEKLTGSSDDEEITSVFKRILDICKGISILKEVTEKSKDFIITSGEVLSSHIISKYLQSNVELKLFNSKDFIVTAKRETIGKVDMESSRKNIKKIDKLARVNIFPGFIASTSTGTITSLGRGGSDYSASLFANLFDASELQIWTDVSGIMSADPKLVRQASVLPHLSFEEALELSHFGAKVIYPPSIQPALAKQIPIRIKNTFKPEEAGTLITKESKNDKSIIQGISSIKNAVILNLSGAGMMGIPTITFRFFKTLADLHINAIMITQASSVHSICVAINEKDLEPALEGLKEEFFVELRDHLVDEITVENKLAIVALVGSNMINQVGVSGKTFHTLGRNGISVKAIAQGSSERNISFVIPSKNLKKALNILHESFFLSEEKVLNLFIIGVGNVGRTFIEQIEKQQPFLRRMQKLNVRIVGLANSKKMCFDDRGIRLSDWKKSLEAGDTFSTNQYLERVYELNLINSIFIDITAAQVITDLYRKFLSKSISVVTPNKLGATSSMRHFKNLHEISVRNGVQFLYETNVAAGLPVISTLKDLVKSGDKITKIEAVLSGTLNYLFNTYDTSIPFVEVIKDARQKGLTEPDPREDLLGEDVKRKILILARETGLKLEMEDVKFDSFLPEEAQNASSIEEFYAVLEKNERHFVTLYKSANNQNHKLRVVASLRNKVPSLALQSISPGHSFYNLEGKDNIVLFYTSRYAEQPLTVKGAGAGAEVTASGIFADILKISAN